ncbi:hypothetical protein FQN57_003288 [Myotisia sp. PD_48]|nr:hypothetical protein FQN57_003288 [Myotisia sp. PD_48]
MSLRPGAKAKFQAWRTNAVHCKDKGNNNPNDPMASSRLLLHTKAVVLRVLMRIGMVLHGYPFPFPPRPSFRRTVPCPEPASQSCQQLSLCFYTPRHYSSNIKSGYKYPVLVNFHGGGFVIGRATDDARWARVVVEKAQAVVVSVDYRLAPEHPFPTAVDDGVRALNYLESHAEELGLDISRVALSGFSAGGNLAFTVPLRRFQLLLESDTDTSSPFASQPLLPPFGLAENISSSSTPAVPLTSTRTHNSNYYRNYTDDEDNQFTNDLLMAPNSRPNPARTYSSQHLLHPTPTATFTSPSSLRIVSVISWYPIVDYVLSRSVRRDRSAQPSKTLPAFLTSLFDCSYMPNDCDRRLPHASPLLAPPSLLAAALPRDIFLYVCEWDMLLQEGQEFMHKLSATGKRVRSMMIEQRCHAWDKSVNPFRNQGQTDILYSAAAEQLWSIFERPNGLPEAN